MKFQTISKHKNRNLHMNTQANTCKNTGCTFRQSKKFQAKYLQKVDRKSPDPYLGRDPYFGNRRPVK